MPASPRVRSVHSGSVFRGLPLDSTTPRTLTPRHTPLSARTLLSSDNAPKATRSPRPPDTTRQPLSARGTSSRASVGSRTGSSRTGKKTRNNGSKTTRTPRPPDTARQPLSARETSSCARSESEQTAAMCSLSPMEEKGAQKLAGTLLGILERKGKGLRHVFREWDEDKDCSLSCEEFQHVLSKKYNYPCTKADVANMMRLLDADFNGQIELPELQSLLKAKVVVGKGGEVNLKLPEKKIEQTVAPPEEIIIPGVINAPAGASVVKMQGGAFESATAGQWRLPVQWASQPFPEPLRRFQKSLSAYQASRSSVRDSFREWDVDKDGYLTFQEFKNGMEKIDPSSLPSDAELELLFHGLDSSDGAVDGKIDFNAFQQLTKEEDSQSLVNTVRPDPNKVNGFPLLTEDAFQQMKQENTAPMPKYKAEAAIKALTSKLCERKSSMEMFKLFNWNPDPLQTKEAMRKCDFLRGLKLLSIELSPEEGNRLWGLVDSDNSGEMNYYEFLEAFYPDHTRKFQEREGQVQMTFDDAYEAAEHGNKDPVVKRVQQRLGQIYSTNAKAFRTNKHETDKCIATADLEKMFKTSTFGLTDQQVAHVLDHADQSKDGYIDYAEFCTTLMPQMVDRKGNPMQLLRTPHTTYKIKRETYNSEFTPRSAALNSTFGANATGGRFGLRPHKDTFQHFQPDPIMSFQMTGNRAEQMVTTNGGGMLPGVGLPKTPRSTNVPRGARRLAGEALLANRCAIRDEKLEKHRNGRIQNIFNRRTLYVNELHHDPRNEPKLAKRFNH